MIFKRLGDWWANRQRRIDLDLLWPVICANAKGEEHARALFYVHAMMDPAWRRLDMPAVIRTIRTLPYPAIDNPVDKREDQL